MSLKLYKTEISPPARAVMMLCDILDLKPEIIEVNLLTLEHRTQEFSKLNPCHTVPVLVDGDIIIQNSHAIFIYLMDTYGNSSTLYPKDVKQRALVNQKLFLNDAVLFSRLRNVTFPAFAEGVRGITEKQINDIIEAYDLLEVFLSKTKFLASDNITIADVATIPTVSAYLHIVPLNAEKYPKLDAWIKEMTTQPYWEKISAPGDKTLGEILQKVTAQ